ncbi:JAB-like toxin 1 domain-containing protein [Flavobacterium sp.]|uniref:JAB-like toxin 1 domain-containing protein n=1 Tax=Flavobacterium sp. TaxID=239 RepID=UPI0038D02C90
MIKYYFFILLFLSFSILSAQEKLTKEERVRREKNVKAGNPFVKYGCKAPVATLSKGKYLEVHDLDSIVIIGTTRWHVYKKIIVGEIMIDSLNLDAQPTGDVPGMWMSPDPLSEEYPSWNPYNYCFNNPVHFVDPDGRKAIDNDDTYGLDSCGNITRLDNQKYYENGKEVDKLVKIDNNNRQTEKAVTVPKGVLGNQKTKTDYEGVQYDYFKIKGNAKAKEVFEFAATNTDVEWTRIGFDRSSNYIGSSHEGTTDSTGPAILADMINNGLFPNSHDHSHPEKYTVGYVYGPSGFEPGVVGDKQFAGQVQAVRPKMTFRVYIVKDKTYLRYDGTRKF